MIKLVFAIALIACNNVSYINPTTTPSGIAHESTGHFFLAGLVGHAEVWANCERGVASVHSLFTFGDELLSVVTLGIYTPRTYRVECGR